MPAKKKITATVSTQGTIRWAVIVTGEDLDHVHTMKGSPTSKSVDVETDKQGNLNFSLVIGAFPGTGWEFKLQQPGADKPTYSKPGVNDFENLGRHSGTVSFD